MEAHIEGPDVVGDQDLVDAFRASVGEDLRLLAELHDRELDALAIKQLKQAEFPSGLGLFLHKELSQSAAGALGDAIKSFPDATDKSCLDALAVDFAEIYLTHRVRAAPTESVWLDKDHLERQQPMFQVRAAYRKRGLEVNNWRSRPDDHLVIQLLFVAHLIDKCEDVASLEEAASFLDKHLLRWIDDFAETVAARCATPFYAALALLTAHYLDEFRDVLAALLKQDRPDVEDVGETIEDATGCCAALPVNGPAAGPTW